MGNLFILYMVITFSSAGHSVVISQEHFSQQTCEAARDSIRQKLADGKVVLATCAVK